MNGEFQYEKEIRLDEERIARYFDNIPFFIDLPGENEAILERIGKVGNEKFQKCSSIEQLRNLSQMWNFDEADEPEDDGDHTEISADYELPELLDRIAVWGAEKFALCDEFELNCKYLGIICQCGKTIARVSDMLLSPDEDVSLKIALAKRSLRDVSDLAGMIIAVETSDAEAKLDILQIIRKKVLEILFEFEKN